MTCDARQFSKLFFDELAAGNIASVILDLPPAAPANIASSIKYSVADTDLSKLRPILVALARQNGWLLVRTFQASASEFTAILVNPNDSAENLSLQACSDGKPSFLRLTLHKFKRALQPSGFCVAVLGSDGAGKSTLLERLQILLLPCFPRQQTIHFRPSVFEKKKTGVVTDPHGRPPRGLVASWLKVGYYFADHWIGWLLLVRPWKIHGTLVIFDRSFDDLLVDQKRYRLQKTSTLARMLRKFVPGIDRTIVLSAPAEVLHQRKPELPIAELARQQQVLHALAKAGANYKFISAESRAEQVAQTAWHDVVTFLAAREEQRAHE